ncbi:MAG: AAA family ATPase [Lachnospiraceae bacterium]|nr:AAA family ATPase [Lachnospiraceae bacterium]
MQKIGIGYEFYKDIVDDRCYYVDKTLFIRDVIEKGGKVTLFTRPRRFGKTLALTTLQTFFECECDREGNVIDNSRYFFGKKIMGAGKEIISKLGQYPVIFLSLKSVAQTDFSSAFYRLRYEIFNEVIRHSYVLNADRLNDADREKMKDLLKRAAKPFFGDRADSRFTEEISVVSQALKTLSACLKQYHGKDTIILLDEYDVPLESAYFGGFYEEMTGFVRSFFESTLKTNPSLEFAVVTGCLRISRESIFTGLNHLEINSIRATSFGEYFGFTQEETTAMLSDYGLLDKVDEVKDWYDGYLFGLTEVYNPWSVTKYVKDHVNVRDWLPESYWANTSSNAIVRNLIEKADKNEKEDLEVLIDSGTVEKKIHEDITYADLESTEDDNLWNFLFFTGYLRKEAERMDGEEIHMLMRIPNREVRSIFSRQVRGWFERMVKATDRETLYRAVMAKDTQIMEEYVTDLLDKAISVFDGTESFYHGFLLSILIGLPHYTVKSNREEGDGRPDIILYPGRRREPAIIFEIKVRKAYNKMDDGIAEAFSQMQEKRYAAGILAEGYNGVVAFAGCFCKKSVIFDVKPNFEEPSMSREHEVYPQGKLE